jgi:hypothetical protein
MWALVRSLVMLCCKFDQHKIWAVDLFLIVSTVGTLFVLTGSARAAPRPVGGVKERNELRFILIREAPPCGRGASQRAGPTGTRL